MNAAEMDFELNFEKNGYILKGVRGCPSHVLCIPEAYNSLPVVGANVIVSCDDVFELQLPKSITYIKMLSFSNLKRVSVDGQNPCFFEGADGALYSKDKSTLILVPKSQTMTSYKIAEEVEKVLSGALFGCKNIHTIYIPEHVREIEDEAFGGMPLLERFDVSPKNKHFATDAHGVLYSHDFSRLVAFPGGSLVGRYEINESTISIEKHAMRLCPTLEYLKIPASVTDIGDERAFDRADRLSCIEVCADNPTFKSIDGVLYNKDATKLIKYPSGKESECFLSPSSVKSIFPFAFYNSRQLKSIVIHSDIELIPDYCFSGCSELKSAELPCSVRSIGNFAFSGCTSLKDISFPAMLEYIDSCAFQNCESLSCAILGNNVKKLGIMSFSGCKSLTRVKLGKNISGEFFTSEFDGCVSLRRINIPAGIKTIGAGLFSSCQKLSHVSFAHKKWETVCFERTDSGIKTVHTYFPSVNAKNLRQRYCDSFWTKA